MSISDNATTLVSNVQSMAAVGNVNLRAAIEYIKQALDDKFVITAPGFAYDIPQIDLSDFPDLIAEVQGYLDGIVADSQAIDAAIVNNSAKAITKLQEISAAVLPSDVTLTMPELTVAFATEVMAAERALNETKRKQDEQTVLAEMAARKFPSPPGVALDAIMEIRRKSMKEIADRALEVKANEQRQNAKLFVDRIETLFTLQSTLIKAWNSVSELTIKLIGQIIADYEKSPMLDATVAADTALALSSAYAGLNKATMELVRAGGMSYRAQLAPYKLDVLEDGLAVDAYQKSMDLTLAVRARAASALASALGQAGHVAGAALGSIGVHGSFVERSFS